MPRDPRLYMTFPIDFDEHPKVEPLSDAAFRTFVAMNGYSRRQRLDGRIPVAVARKRWRVRALAELCASDPSKPLVLLEGDVYVIRDYAEHQFTTADEAELHARKAAAGAKGGRAKAAAVAGAKHQPKQDLAGSGIGIEIETTTDHTHDSEVRPEIPARVERIPFDDFILEQAATLGIRNLTRVQDAIEGVTGRYTTAAILVDTARAVILLAKDPVTRPEAYIERTAKNTPETILAEFARAEFAAPVAVA
jgi:hypothetical protein